jgi:hypothetical protein
VLINSISNHHSQVALSWQVDFNGQSLCIENSYHSTTAEAEAHENTRISCLIVEYSDYCSRMQVCSNRAHLNAIDTEPTASHCLSSCTVIAICYVIVHDNAPHIPCFRSQAVQSIATELTQHYNRLLEERAPTNSEDINSASSNATTTNACGATAQGQVASAVPLPEAPLPSAILDIINDLTANKDDHAMPYMVGIVTIIAAIVISSPCHSHCTLTQHLRHVRLRSDLGMCKLVLTLMQAYLGLH